jgi:bacterioferritin (cytochrome b1)
MTEKEFLELVQSDLVNEWTHLQFYLYHASTVNGLHALELKEFLTSAASGEMEHVQAFLDRLIGRNVKPAHTSGRKFAQHTDPKRILQEAATLEEEVVSNYADRLRQLESLVDSSREFVAYFTIFYEDQLQDSYEDCEKIRNLLR